MSERRLRLVLAGVMFVTIFLRCDPRSGTESAPNWVFIFLFSIEALSWLFTRKVTYTLNFTDWLNVLNYLSPSSVLLLIPSNIFLAVCPFRRLSRWLKTLYRIYVLILLPWTWHFAVGVDPGYGGVRFWAPVVVSAAALVEIILLIGGFLGGLLKKPGDAAVE